VDVECQVPVNVFIAGVGVVGVFVSDSERSHAPSATPQMRTPYRISPRIMSPGSHDTTPKSRSFPTLPVELTTDSVFRIVATTFFELELIILHPCCTNLDVLSGRAPGSMALCAMPERPRATTMAIRADANDAIGAGHVMRCVALADAWRRAGGDALLFTTSPPPLVRAVVERRGLGVQSYASVDEATAAVVAWVRSNADAWVVLDSYDIGRAAQQAIRAAGARLLVIDDYAGTADVECDILLNQNIGADRLPYRLDAATRCCFGPKFALLRGEFLHEQPAYRFEPVASRLVATFGGADVHNQAARVARILAGARPPVDATIVAGDVHQVPEVQDDIAAGIRIRWQRATERMVSVLAGAEMAICAAGSTCWELAYLGVPALTLVVAGNQTPIATGLHEAGIVRNAGWFDAVSDHELALAIDTLRRDEARAEMSRRGRALVDGFGADRVVEAMRLAAVEA
jgi:UDP-2,4-diacetamido-2,4,6-trideoxy-beta-L-altropyranose hydrolase